MPNFFTVLVSALVATFIVGCASGPQSTISPQRASDSKLGVVILVDDKPKHVHVGTTALNTFEKPISQDWQLKNFIMETVRSEMQGKAEVVKLEVTKPLQHEDGTTKVGWVVSIRDSVKDELERMAKEQNLFAVLVIEPAPSPVEASSFSAAGYGVTTRCFFKYCKAFYLDHVDVKVAAIPVAKKYYSAGTSGEKNRIIKIDLSDGVKSVAAQDLTLAKDKVYRAFAGKIKSALTNAGI